MQKKGEVGKCESFQEKNLTMKIVSVKNDGISRL